MRRYIQQLVDQYKTKTKAIIAELEQKELEQLDAFKNGSSPVLDELNADESFESHIADVEAYLEGPREHIDQPLAYYAEIDLEALPPADGLSNEEAQALYDTLNDLISFYGQTVEVYLADDCPSQLYYSYLLQVISKPARMMNGGHSGHGCIYWAPNCEFGEYCGCIAEHWLREEYIEQGGSPDVPQHRFSDPKEILARRKAEKEEEAKWDLEGGF